MVHVVKAPGPGLWASMHALPGDTCAWFCAYARVTARLAHGMMLAVLSLYEAMRLAVQSPCLRCPPPVRGPFPDFPSTRNPSLVQ